MDPQGVGHLGPQPKDLDKKKSQDVKGDECRGKNSRSKTNDLMDVAADLVCAMLLAFAAAVWVLDADGGFGRGQIPMLRAMLLQSCWRSWLRLGVWCCWPCCCDLVLADACGGGGCDCTCWVLWAFFCHDLVW